jgi:hypothetical protein
MNSTTHNSNYDLDQQRLRLEALLQAEGCPSTEGVRQRVSTILCRLGRLLLHDNELRVWQRTYQGRTIWYAHDPLNNRARRFYSEQELRFWLENRYYE